MLTIYKASAGSGKTFTLAYEYIKTLLGLKLRNGSYCLNSDKYAPGGRRHPRRHRCIMALTFTNAATDEMKRRIVRQIDALASPEVLGSDYGRRLTEAYGCTAEELRQAASTALGELLYDYSNFYVSTIDSFFQSVLRAFSREVDRQGDYELALDAHDAIGQSISLMLDELNYASPPGATRLIDWISMFTLQKVRDGHSFNFFERDGRLIGTLAKTMEKSMDETFGEYSIRLRSYLADASRIDSFDKALRRAIDSAYDRSRELGRAVTAGLKAAGLPDDVFGAVHKRIALLELPKPDINSRTFDTKAFKPGHDDCDIFGTAAKYRRYADALGMAPVLDFAREFCEELPRAYRRRKMYETLLDSLGTLDFIGMALEALEKFLRDSNTVLLSDTGELLKRIISDAEMPFIYERLGMKLETLLIDEFQDTSGVQWHNLKPLVGNSLSYGFDNLIIGDEKQSIYRFRNSDSELLGHKVQAEDFPDHSVVRGNSPGENTNWRSAGDIVRFNNTVFRRLTGVFDAPYYTNVVQTPSNKYDKLPAFVQIHFHPDAEVPSDEEILEKLATDILRQHNSGYRWADIMVLCRYRGEAAAVVKYLTSRHPEIQVLSSEALLLRNSAAVRSVMSMLKLVARSYQSRPVVRPDGAASYASHADVVLMITRYNHFEAEGYTPSDALEAALREGEGAAGVLKEQVDAVRAENPANLVALIEAIIAHKLSPAQRRDEYAYIAALQDLAVKQAESAEPSLTDFIAAYDRNIDRWAIKASADLDAVEVMTVHKSKGLERACVHIPFGDWSMYYKEPMVWIPMDGFSEFAEDLKPPLLRVAVSTSSPLRDPEISPVAQLLADDRKAEITDNLNAAYVAFTRASRELIIHTRMQYMGADLHGLFLSPDTGRAVEHTIDLTAGFDSLTETYTLGQPTLAEKEYAVQDGCVDAGEYEVVYRADTRELVSIDDVLSADLDIGGEEDKEIFDSCPAFEGTPEMKEAARRGSNLHAILASMRTVGDLDRALDRQCAREDVDEAEAKSYRQILLDAIAAGGETVDAWFDPTCKVYAERSIYVPESDESFRPDRVVVRPDGSVAVVDYKFTTEVRAGHHRQVSRYVELLRRLGRPGTEGYIWYPEMKKIIKV